MTDVSKPLSLDSDVTSWRILSPSPQLKTLRNTVAPPCCVFLIALCVLKMTSFIYLFIVQFPRPDLGSVEVWKLSVSFTALCSALRTMPGTQQALIKHCRKNQRVGTSLAVQWFGLIVPVQGAWVWSLVGELRSHMWPKIRKEKECFKYCCHMTPLEGRSKAGRCDGRCGLTRGWKPGQEDLSCLVGICRRRAAQSWIVL